MENLNRTLPRHMNVQSDKIYYDIEYITAIFFMTKFNTAL